ncbi:hypothetical protein AB0J55_38230 [Amycolatopsis sp. NPDC049688]|uniref:hypothetical protein n=1 Tax=Amycolatopsis sp. NPDC049688 TaxID=3154733 RepID=UPI003438F0AC
MPLKLAKLQKRTADSNVHIETLRPVTEDEERSIRDALLYCRTYAARLSTRLVVGAKSNFDEVAGRLNQHLHGDEVRQTSEELSASLVALALIWRLCLDQLRHDISDRFGKDSEQLNKFALATNRAYDEHFGYRLIEGLRNYVAHRAMPPISGNVEQKRGNSPGEVIITATITLAKAPLLESGKMPKTLKNDLEAYPESDIPLPETIDDGMVGFQKVNDVVFEIDRPQLENHLTRLRNLILETQPDVPALVDFTTTPTGGKFSDFIRFDDLFWLLGVNQATQEQSKN